MVSTLTIKPSILCLFRNSCAVCHSIGQHTFAQWFVNHVMFKYFLFYSFVNFFSVFCQEDVLNFSTFKYVCYGGFSLRKKDSLIDNFLI